MIERTPWSMSRLTCAIRAVRNAPHDSDGEGSASNKQ